MNVTIIIFGHGITLLRLSNDSFFSDVNTEDKIDKIDKVLWKIIQLVFYEYILAMPTNILTIIICFKVFI